MNDDRLTDDQLRLATSRALPSDAQLDTDTAATRESFLAFGAAIESAVADYDEPALIARLQSACVTTKPRPQFDWWPLIVTGALAAGMLLAIARLAMEARRQDDRPSVAGAPAASPSKPRPATTLPATLVAWTDPIDDEIALAAATIDQFSGPRRGFDSSLLDMNDRLQALSQELTGETL